MRHLEATERNEVGVGSGAAVTRVRARTAAVIAALAMTGWTGVARAQDGDAAPAAGTEEKATPEPGAFGIGGYGEAWLTHDDEETEAQLRRLVLYVGHRFNDWAVFSSEIEIEEGHELELEQAFLELSPWGRRARLHVGLVLVPLGIVNVVHEPPTFNGVDRPIVDQLVIPSTWRELGVGVAGDFASGLHYRVDLLNGLNAAAFSPYAGIRPGRGNGEGEVQARDAALAARVHYDGFLGLDVGAGAYVGGAGQGTEGLDGVKVGIVEADVRFARRGLSLRAEFARAFVSDADRVTAFLRETDPSSPAMSSALQGLYLEAGYDVLRLVRPGDQQLVPFVRYENVDTRASLPDVLAPGGSGAMEFLFAGLTYLPHPQLVFKADWRRTLSGSDAAAAAELGEEDDRFSLGAGFMF